jgi:hypothetical protein
VAESEGVIHPTDDAEADEDLEIAIELAEFEPFPKALVGAYLIG